MLYRSLSVDETMEIGQTFVKNLQGGVIVSLVGDLGAGKTVFSKGVAMGLGISETITSPTFVLSCEYQGTQYRLLHIDAYRLEGVDVTETGISDEIGRKDTITLIEWAKFLVDVVPDYEVTISVPTENTQDKNFRQIDIHAF